ncbi:protein folD 2 [Gluconacetobacter sp. SXCC-1]|mgnify:CR=1 FL=1|uniref:bifunctional 5,10-methylenetetrahydrofolate dehydrogenase/5,10-methenyltetrahydrofolate cyclohydrolase n=1 Tax=Komagataeibacter rhaeticus TaxID=215221 RepID=UPI000207F861|nr:bifunctional 5,10-methylenetetrahydrofolate dehydrogenase/5,10-methenyltetrahydrofolate cyclohydrolase [Komagataeibacter rhaeticus]ATU72779.1 bifunctional 5,10-methylenetetrahydrofolate dehydrogenase/5,10-methenyltetrahydrofolate cyclohydrolase [Komagataeibacter xylinus]EGG76509.1 protein folD 2 [Gluconacetobacter sp. SXCC-1]WPP22553.1 bifunctional 5,10-methylenetetrahydrofolate dehydrogenase/5,10-methenyltetrahydrofolate cyclohydrolase [Komagataeibacter rhaeticus]
MATLFNLDLTVARLMDSARTRAAALARRGIRPALALLSVGADAHSRLYISRKVTNCHEAGIHVDALDLPPVTGQAALLAHIARLNADPRHHGIMVQLPLPPHLDERAICRAIAVHKDVDGLHPCNVMALHDATPGIMACTVRGIAHLLAESNPHMAGLRVTIIGRGELVGLPAALLLGGRSVHGNADVTILHTHSRNLADSTRQADIVIAAAGVPGLLAPDMLRPGATVIGVGMTWHDGQVRGDLSASMMAHDGWITPPDTSFGGMTRMMLLHNILDVADADA